MVKSSPSTTRSTPSAISMRPTLISWPAGGARDRAADFFGGVHQVFVVRQAPGVGQQVTNGDGAAIGGEVREDVAEFAVVLQLAVMDQQHGGHGGELLGERRQPEIGLLVDFGGGAEVADSIAALEERAAVVADQDGQAGRLRIGER